MDLIYLAIGCVGIAIPPFFYYLGRRARRARFRLRDEMLRIIGDPCDAELFEISQADEHIVFVFPSGGWDLSDEQRAKLKTSIRTRIEEWRMR